MDFYGFKIETKSLPAIEKIVNEMKVLIYKKAQKLFAELLSQEIQTLVDELATNVYGDATLNQSIYKESVAILNKKISIAMAKGYDTEYNFNAALNVFSYEKDTYLQLATPNKALYDAAKEANGLKDLSIFSEIDSEQNKELRKLWDAIVKGYQDHSCFVIKLFPLGPFESVNFEKMNFKKPQQRAEILAHRRIVNQYLSIYAGGGDIPPHKLMEYMEQAIAKASSPETKSILEKYTADLLAILPVITEELIMRDPKEEAPKTFTEADGESTENA